MALKPKTALFAILALLLVAHGGQAMALDKVSVQLMWFNQAQFAGVYMAHDMGIYKKYGLDVDIRRGGPTVLPLNLLEKGDCDFAIAWLSEAIVKKEKGVKLLHLAQVVQKSAVLLVALKNTGIKTLQDLRNKRVGMWGGLLGLPPKAMLRSEAVAVDVVPQNSTMVLLTSGAVAAASAMRYNELHVLYQMGVDFDQMRIFDLTDYGINFPEDGIYAMQKTWDANPDMCRRFVQATLEGWQTVFTNPEKALESVMKRVTADQSSTNIAHQKWMLDTMKGLVKPRPDTQLGHLSPDDFNQTNQGLSRQGLINMPISWKGFSVPAWSDKNENP